MAKRFLLALLLISTGMPYLAGGAFAQDIFLTDVSLGERINLGVNCSAVLPAEDDSDAGIFVGGLLSFDVLKYLAVGIEGGYIRYTEVYESVEFGTINAFPLLGDVILKAPFEMDGFTLVPYGIVGTGVLFSDYDESSFIESLGLSLETEPAFLLKLGGGVDFYVTDTIALNFEGSYNFADVDIDARWMGQSFATDTVEADYWLIGGGLKVRF